MTIILLQKRGEIMKVIRYCLMLLACLIAFESSVFASSPVSWYCLRAKNHIQPSLSDELLYAEKYDLFWCDKKHSSFEGKDKVIYLTFDAGYENGNVEKILDVLKEENVCATFFILDNLILKNKDLVKRMIDEGHVVGNHTLKHKDMTKMQNIDEFQKELASLETLFQHELGVAMPKYYRPPEGKISEQSLKWAKELGYKTVMWSFAYADWDNERQPSHEYAERKIYDNLHNGEVMLLHPTSKTNAEIIKGLIQNLKDKGFRFATVEELCEK